MEYEVTYRQDGVTDVKDGIVQLPFMFPDSLHLPTDNVGIQRIILVYNGPAMFKELRFSFEITYQKLKDESLTLTHIMYKGNGAVLNFHLFKCDMYDLQGWIDEIRAVCREMFEEMFDRVKKTNKPKEGEVEE